MSEFKFDLPSDLEQRKKLIAETIAKGEDPKAVWADFGDYDCDYPEAAPQEGVKFSTEDEIEQYYETLRPQDIRLKELPNDPDKV